MNNSDQTLPTISCRVNFTKGRRGKKVLRLGKPKPTRSGIPRISRQMALAFKLEALMRKGLIKDYAELSRLGHADRSLITRLMNLRLLAPDIQERLLSIESMGHPEPTLKELLPVTRITCWEEQRRQPIIKDLNIRQRASQS